MGKFTFQITFVFFAITSFASYAEENTKPVSKEDLVGVWEVVAFMPGSFGEKFTDSDLLAPAQIYGFYEDGHVRSLTSDSKKSFNYTLDELESRFGNRVQKIRYTFLDQGLVAITIDEAKKIGTLWQTHIVTKEHNLEGLQIQKNDLIMGMTPEKSSPNDDFRYIRIMRKPTLKN